MSTKPPTEVMMPSVSSSGFKAVLDLLELGDVRAQFRGRNVVGLAQQRMDFDGITRFRLGEPLRRSLDLVPQPLMHAADIGFGQLSPPGLLIDQRPFGCRRARLLDIFEVRLRAFRTGGQKESE